MKKEKFDYNRFIALAELVKETEYVKILEDKNEYAYFKFLAALEELKSSYKIEDDEDYTFDSVSECVQNLIFADETNILPESLADLVHLVYDEAVTA